MWRKIQARHNYIREISFVVGNWEMGKRKTEFWWIVFATVSGIFLKAGNDDVFLLS